MAEKENQNPEQAANAGESAAALLVQQNQKAANELAANNNSKAPEQKTAENKAPVEEQDDFIFHVDEKEEGAGEANEESKPAQFDRKRWKELDDDIDVENFDEEKVFSRARGYKEKYNQTAVLAQAAELVENDQFIKTIKGHLGKDDEALVQSAEIAMLMKAGYDKEAAEAEAATVVAGYKEESPSYLKNKAREIRLELTSAVNERKSHLNTQIETSRKALSLSEAPNPELINKSIEALGKTKTFLGIPIGSKSEQGMKDFMKPIQAGIKDGSIIKRLQSDPELLAKVALLALHEKDFTRAVTKRVENAKTKALKGLADAPYSAGKAAANVNAEVTLDKDGAPALKDPSKFK